MENDSVSMDIQVNTQVNDKGVDKVAQGMSNIATNASKAEENVQGLSKTVKDLGTFIKGLNGKIKPGVDLTEIEKALAQIEKGKDQSLDKVIPMFADKLAKEVSGKHNLRTSEGLLSKTQGFKDRAIDADRVAELRYQKMMSNVHAQNKSWNSFNPIYDETSAYQNKRRSDMISSMRYTSAERKMEETVNKFNDFTDNLINDFEKKVEQLNRYAEDKTKGFTLVGEAKQISPAAEEIKQSFLAQKHANDPTPLLLTPYAGVLKEVQETLQAQKKVTEATEQIAEATEEIAKTEKKTAKSKEMTQFQKEKVEAKAAEVAAYDKRTDAIMDANAQKQARFEASAGAREFRNAHPELFATGGQYFNKRYQVGGAFQNVGNKMSQMGTAGRVLGDLFQTIGMFVKSPIAGTATAVSKIATGLLDLGKAATQAFAEIESIKTQLGVVFSNQTQAEGMFGQISQYAIKSPFGVQQTSELAVLLKQSGVYASDLMNTLKMLGDTAGGNMEKMKRIANNYAQIVSIGKASMLDMRQFAYAGIPIFEAVSKELKVSQQELRKMISDGKVTSDIIAKVFKDLTGINGIFENATAKGAKTLKARLQNLQDAKQLALSSLGDSIVNAGSTRGNDSIVLNFVQSFENFFAWAKEHQDVKNIERDVKLIANSNSRIKELEDMLKMAEEQGNEDLKKLIQAELNYQKSIYTFEKQRQIYAGSYDVKNAEAERFKEKYGEYDQEYAESILRKLGEAQAEYFASNSKASGRLKGIGVYKELTDEERQILKEQIEMYTMLTSELADYARALEKAKTTTEEEIKAARERDLLETQQQAFDRANTFSDASTSLMTSFQELNEIYKASDEYKEKKEAERQKTLEEALKVLKDIANNVDDNGIVDITKYSPSKFVELVTSGAFKAVEKLDVVRGDKPSTPEERERLERQYGGFQTQFEEFISQSKFKNFFSNAYIADNFKLNNLANKQRFSNEEFYDKFSEWYKNYDTNLTQAIEDYKKTQEAALQKRLPYVPVNQRETEKDRVAKEIEEFTKQVEEFRDSLEYSLNGFETGAKDAANVTEEMLNEAKNVFIPLWKRIFATNTGLSTQGMVTPRKTLDSYLTDVANRNAVANVMKATLQTLGVDAATNLLKPGDKAMELLGTEGSGRFIYQTDWKKSNEALKDFAKQLSASTEIVSAYRQSLEDELDVLNNLIVQGATEMESQDLEKQKLVTVKQLQKLSEAGMSETASQLVNALGNKLVTADNLEVAFRDGKFYDSEGNEVAEEQLKITDDIYEYIKTLLPEIKSEIARSKVTERNNQEMATWIEKVLPNELSKMVMRTATSEQTDISRYLHENTNYLTDQFNNSFDIVLERFKKYGVYDETTALGKENIVAQYLSGDKQAETIVKAVIREVIGSAESLGVGTSGSTFQRLIEESLTTERDTAARDRLLKLLGSDTYYQKNPNAWLGEGGYSYNKIVNDAFGVTKDYTMQDLYDQYNGTLDKTIKNTIYWKEALEDVKEVMRSMGEETAKLSGDLTKRSWLTPFEQWGETQMKVWTGVLSAQEQGEEYTKATSNAYKELGTEALNALGPIMAKAGFELVARGAIDNNWALILGGLGLAAAGGFATGLGNALSEKQDDSTKDEAEKIQDLKDQLADLLEQARKDALYYENNMRHKKALGINKEFSYQSVHDAVITPQGDVITTDPKDYLIATKTPEQFAGGNVTPIINNNIINNSSAKVRQEQQQNPDGSIDIITIIEDAVGNYIASSKSDDAFNAREYRMRGKQSIMS